MIYRHKAFKTQFSLRVKLYAMVSFFALWSVLAWSQPQQKPSKEAQQKKLSALIKEAQKYYENADFQMAAVYYKEALELAPEREDLKRKLEDTEKKITEQNQLRALLPKDPKKKEAFLKQKYSDAKKLYSQDKLNEAYSEFYQIWLISGKYKRTTSYLEKIRKLIKKREEEAKRAQEEKLRKAKEEEARRRAEIERKKKEAEELVAKANKELAKGKYEKARKYFEKALEIDKENKSAVEGLKRVSEAEAKAKQAEAMRKAKEEEARRRAEIERKKKEAEELVAKANKELAKGKYEKARKYFEKALEIDKENKSAVEGLKRVSEAEAKAKQAEAMRKAKEEEARRQAEIERKKKEAEELVAKANKYLGKQDFDKAITFFTRALELDKENKSAQEGLARARQERDRRILAEKKRQEQENLIKSHLEKGTALYKEEKFESALKEFKAVLALDSNNKTAQKYAQRCEAKIKELEKEKAEAEARKKQIEENLAKAQEMMSKGDYENAIALYKEVLKLDDENERAKSGIARAEELLAMKERKEKEEAKKKQQIAKLMQKANSALSDGDYKEAKELFNEVLKIDPKNEQAQQGLAKAQSLEQEAEKRKLELAQAKEKEVKKETEEKAKKEEMKPEEKEKKPSPAEVEKQKKELEEIERIKREQQEKAEKLTNKGKELFQKGEYEEALRYFEDALSLYPLNVEAQELKKKTEEKIAELKRQEELKKQEEMRRKELQQRVEQLCGEAEVLCDQNKFEEAEKKVDEALKLIPDFDKAIKLRSKIQEAKQSYQKEEAERLVEEGLSLFKQGDYKGAIEKFNAGLRIDPTNEVAARYITLSQQKIEEQKREEERRQMEAKKSEAQRLFKEGLAAYQQKNLEEAINKWKQALKVYPELKEAQDYLDKTKEEYQQYLVSKAKEEEFLTKEENAKKKMNTLVNIETKRPIPLRDFLRNLYIITDIDFYVAEGVEATIEAKFEDKPLHEVLDAVLLPIGLKWERKPGTDIVIVSPDLKMRAFELTPQQLTKVKALMDNKFIQRMLWGGKTEPSLKGVELTLDERESVLFMTDSEKNIRKMETFLRDLQKEAPPTLEWRSYKIDPRDADKIKAILEAMLEVEKPTPYSRERRILISGDELVIKDTPENIKKAEQILMDKNFIKKIKEEKLVAEVFDITPEGATQENITQVEEFGKYVQAVVENMLYAKTGRSAAEAEGRRLWLRSYIEPPNKPKLTLTVVDYPSNIEAVADLIARLPEVKKGLRSEIIFLKYAKAADISSYLESVLGIAAAPTEVGGAAAGMQIRKTMRVEDEIQFREIFVRLTRVNENDVADENDDSAEFVVRTPTTSEDVTIDEFHSEFVDNYEIVAEEIKPSGSPGQGRVKVVIRYVPQGGAVTPGMGVAATPTPTPAAAAAVEEEVPPISIEPFEDLNALLIRYSDPAKYSEVKQWIDKLDFPTPQVSIEAKFVEVLENRAKEYSAELSIMNLGEGIDLDSSIFNMRFGQYLDEFRDELEPPIEYTTMANLLKGTTIFNWIIAGGESPINYQLRLLEAEGIINVVNGPTITTLSGESADFIIERDPGYYQYDPESNDYVLRPITHVDMSVTPYVTQLGVITLDIDAEIRDFESNLATVIFQQRPMAEEGIGPLTLYHSNTDRSVIRKDLTTIARVQDGGTIVLGGWSGEHTAERHSGVPIFRNLPYIGQLLFGRNLKTIEKTTLLIFLTANVVK